MVIWEIVEVEIVEDVMALVPVKVVLPPWRVKVLPLPLKVVLLLTVKVLEPRLKVPVPLEIVLPLTDTKLTAPVEATVNWLLFPTVKA